MPRCGEKSERDVDPYGAKISTHTRARLKKTKLTDDKFSCVAFNFHRTLYGVLIALTAGETTMRFALTTIAFLAATSAQASAVGVPEMDAGAGVAALALLAGAVAILREKTRK